MVDIITRMKMPTKTLLLSILPDTGRTLRKIII